MPVKKLGSIFKITGALIFAGVLSMAVYLFLQEPPGVKIQRVEEPLSEEGENVLGSSVTSTNNELIFTSEIYEAQMRFNAIALNWKETDISWKEGRRVFLRTSLDNQHWGEWLEIESLGPLRDDDPRPERTFPEVPLLVDGKFFQYQVVIRQDGQANASPNLSDLWVTYIDSRTPLRLKIIGMIKNLLPAAQAAGEGPEIISRAGWGSPDPYGNLFQGTSNYWGPSYYPVKQIFLHHTVFTGSDSAAVVRAIWEYHTYTRGWGDIGYNYLVDQQGKIYEGRFGGDNVVAGHAYTFNNGSLGVAVLGCFQTNSSSCTGAPPPSSTMLNSLTTLLAWKSTNYEIDPTATQTFCGLSSCKTLKTIAGHRDVNATACPGNLIYDQMQTIREQTWNKKPGWSYSAKQLDFGTVSFGDYETEQAVTIRFKNTGTVTWSNTENRLLLRTANPDGRTSIFQGTGWLDSQTPAVLSEASVAPGETGSFTFNLKSPSNVHGYFFENFRLVSEGSTAFTQFFGLVVLPPSYRWEFLGVSHSKGTVSMSSGETQTINLWAKNIGTATWYRDSSWNVRLGTWGPNRSSSFYHSSWFNNIRPALLNQASVAPGETGTFTFKVSAPLTQGWHFERFNLVAEGLTWFNDPGAGAYFYVTSPGYSWEFKGVGHSTGSVFMNPGESQTITLKAKNSGTSTWYRDTSWPIRLGTWGPSRTSAFYHGSWLNNIRPAQLLEESVAPEAVGTFAFNIFVPANALPGWYFERVNLVVEGLVWLNYPTNSGFYIYVLPGYRWEFGGVAHSTGSVSMKPGETQTITLWAKNTGTATWTRDGPWPVRLGTWGPSRPSSFYHSSWFNNIRPALLNQASVAPGEIGTFSFTITAPATKGWYFERINLVAEGLVWLNYPNSGFYIYIP